VPVTDPETGEVVGIVTRTDLLKTLAGRPGSVSERKNIADRLENTLPPAHLALLKAVASRAHDLRQAVYIVGGFVRDLVLNRPSQDFDVVIEGDAITLARSLTQTYGGRTVTHSRFGTAKWQIDDTREELAGKLTEELLFEPQSLPASLDLISARTEFYEHPSALPTVERGSIKLDLHRRDFTINTLALRLDGRHYGELYDFWGGLNDLQKGLVRVLHSLSFIDDPTRILRAVRFEQRFDFAIEERTLQLMNEAKDMLSQVSGERLRHELDLILTESRADTILARLEELGLLEAIHPGLHWHTELAPALKSILLEPIEPDWDLPGETFGQPTRRILGYLIWLLRLPEDTLRAIGYRLRFSSNLQDALLMASRLWHKKDDLIDASPSQVYDALHSSPPAVLYAVHQLAPAQNIRDIIEYYMFRLRQIEIDTDGNRLMQHGVKPGPIYRVILETLKKARLDGEIHSSEEEEALLMRLLHSLNQVR
jgi:tRNA nucleotidyltransferase (CCA-adding enzyme)